MTGFIRLGFAALLVFLFNLQAVASPDSEKFVEENAVRVLASLGDETLTVEDRKAKFQEYMNEFSDQRRIAYFVIGKYARQFSREDLSRYRRAFTEFSLASYEANFDNYRGGTIAILGSQETSSGKYSIVNSTVTAPSGDELNVRWRLLIKDDSYKVVDVGLNLNGNLLWLAGEQRAQFLALLDRNQGSANALIAKLEELTADLQAKVS